MNTSKENVIKQDVKNQELNQDQVNLLQTLAGLKGLVSRRPLK